MSVDAPTGCAARSANDTTGVFVSQSLGIDVNEELAAKYPFPEHPINGAWPEIRRRDGTVQKP